VIVHADDLRATAVRPYNASAVPMPNLERLAASGTVFNHSYSAHPLCCPSRASFWTGQYSSVHGSRHNQKLMSDGTPNLAESFRQAGYQLGIFGKNHCFTPRQLEQWFQTDYSMGSASWKAAILPGTARTVAAHGRWLREQGGPLLPPASAPFPYETFPTHMATQHAINYIERQAGEAFLMWLSLPDPHPPMDVPEKFANVLPPQSLKLPPSRKDEMEGKNTRMKIFDYLIRGREIPGEYLSRYLSIYSGKTAFVDYELGRLMDALQAKGLRENTIFLFTSDNGDFAGEHHLIVKTGSMVDSMVRMPAILSWPGSLPGGRREDALTNHVDFLPTLLNLCGLPALRTAQGMPLPLKTDSRRRQFVYSEYGSGDPEYTWAEARTLGPAARLGDYALSKPLELAHLERRERAGHLRMIRTQAHKLISDSNGEVEFYDLGRDPHELNNVHAQTEYREAEEGLMKLLARGTTAG